MKPEPLWQVIGQSVRGASHVRADLPNQDAITWRLPEQGGPPLILVVSDGHGSAKSFRSDRGSKFAVTVVADLMQELVSGQPDPQNLSMVKRIALERLPTELVRRWQGAVDRDLAENPFTEEELEKLARQRGERSRKDVDAAPRLAYGATVLGVLVAQDFLLFLQLGDGDILTVADDGTVSRPIARDARLIANETTSLCMSEAWREVRLRFQAKYGGLPALIMASTDGYANSFVNDEAFCKVGSDILSIMREDGVLPVAQNLPSWLSEASASGSGDDITLGILYRVDIVRAEPAVASGAKDADVVPDLGAAMDGGAAEIAATTTPSDVSPSASVEASAAPPQSDAGRPKDHVSDDLDRRSRFVARIKHEGPSEPIKHVGLIDVVGDDTLDPADHEQAGSGPAGRESTDSRPADVSPDRMA